MPPWHVGGIGVSHPYAPYNFVGHSEAGSGGENHYRYSMPLPAGARIGDLMFLLQLGRNQAYTNDPRLTTLAQGKLIWGWSVAFSVGYVDYLGDIDMVTQSAGGGIGQFEGNHLVLVRGEEIDGIVRNPVRWNPDRFVMSAENSSTIPALPKMGSGAIVMQGAYGGIGGAWTGTWQNTPGGRGYPFARVASSSIAAYQTSVFGRHELAQSPQAVAPMLGSDDGWRYFVVGLK